MVSVGVISRNMPLPKWPETWSFIRIGKVVKEKTEKVDDIQYDGGDPWGASLTYYSCIPNFWRPNPKFSVNRILSYVVHSIHHVVLFEFHHTELNSTIANLSLLTCTR